MPRNLKNNKSGKTVNQNNADWKYCYVKIYIPNCKKLSDKGKKGTLAHEAGRSDM